MNRRTALRTLLGSSLVLPGILSELLARPGTPDDPLAPKPPHFAPKAKRIIFLFMEGAMSSLDTFEYKSAIEKGDNEALARLSETQRSLVLLKDYEGYYYEEIGQITGLSSSQVKVYLHRARLQLKEYIVKVENVI